MKNNINSSTMSTELSNSSSSNSSYNLTDSASCKGWKWHCGEGLILPVWTPEIDENSPTSTIVLRAFVYLISLIYLLFGVGLITERIITAAEVISNHKRIVTFVSKSGETVKKKKQVWHPVVALILFVIPATSSPEILIPLIDTIKRDFQGSELGASLIVGSGAYHLFIITAICLVSSMDSAPKPIKNQKLFFTTSFFAIFAYLWVYLVLGEISPGVIELWEAIVTFLSFPVLIFSAWFISGPWPERFLKWLKPVKSISPIDSGRSSAISMSDSGIDNGEMTKRKKISKLLQKLRLENPDKTNEELEELAEDEVLMSTPRNAAFYRLHNSESIPNLQVKDRKPRQSRKAVHEDDVERVGFEFEKISCFESCGTFQVSVKREILVKVNDRILLVDFRTIPGTAKPNVNFIPVSSQLVFYPGQVEAKINLEILSDGIFEETDKFFHLKLFDARYVGVDDRKVDFIHQDLEISIMDDDHCGVFSFDKNEVAIPDNIGEAHLKVVRTTGTRGTIKVPFKIMPGTAKDKEDYLCPPWNFITFEPGQQEALIDVRIIDKDRFGKAFTFYIELLMPTKVSQDILFTIGDPVIGECHTIKVAICEDEELKIALDRLLAKTTFANSVTSATWKDQLKSVFSIHLHENYDECTKLRTILVYCYYVLAFPWKLVIALLPPPGFLNGYVSYITYLGLMAIAAGLVGDCAHYLGCTVNIRDTVTAITLIPLGMGLPDTFASRRAARFEKTADAAIGSITGSNAVSNFLGMGISWVVGASYRAYNGGKFKIPPADLGFSVMLYCTFASVVVIILLIRRLPPIRGELGGPVWAKHLTALIFFSLWILFVVLSVLENYCFIPGFQTVNKRY